MLALTKEVQFIFQKNYYKGLVIKMFNKSRLWNNITVTLNFTNRGYEESIVPVVARNVLYDYDDPNDKMKRKYLNKSLFSVKVKYRKWPTERP